MGDVKDFDAMLAEKSGGRPEFVIAGQKFTARGKLPWKKFSTLILSLTAEDTSSADGLIKTEDFFRLVLVPADRQRFIDLINHDGDEDEDDDHIVGAQQVSEILDWLLGHYTGKAVQADNSSTPKSGDSGQPSNVVSLNAKPTSV